MADISKIKLLDDTVFNLKDSNAIPNPASKSEGQYLKYNGTSWIAAEGGGGTTYTAGNNITIDSDTISALKYYKKSEVTGVAGTSSTQLSSTYDVTDASVTEYYDGMVVSFVLPVAGVTTYGSVFQFNSLGYKPIVYGANSSVGTRYPVGGQITMVYNSVQTATAYLTKNVKTTITGCWQVCDYDTSTKDATKVFDQYFRPYAGASAIYRYKLCALDKDNRVAPITITDQTSTTQVAKTPNSVALKTGDLWLYNSTTNISASKVIGAGSLATTYYGDNMCAYNFNASIPAYRMIYLRGTYNETTGLFTLYNDGSSPCTSYYTSVPNNTANINLSSYFTTGYYYWLVGSTYSTADYLQVFGYNPLYYFDGTNLIPYQEHLIANKQDILVSGTNIKTINSESIIGSGNLEVAPSYQQVVDALGYTPLSPESKGVANGVASLDSTGKVPSGQLPSYVDDVVEGYYYNNKFYSDSAHTKEITPESGKIYVDLHTNKTYRWSGSTYVEISSSLTLGETSSTAYRGDRGKSAYDHSQLTSGNPHNVTKSDLGIANVENKSSAAIRGEITSSNITTALGYTPYNSTNPSGYISGINGSDVTTALGYIPYDSANPNGYINGITSSDVTTALGYTPYNSTNPDSYVNQNVNNLTNYFTKTEVQGMVGNRFQALIVETLPTSGISTSTIYMVLQAGQTDIYDEWMYISNTWTKIGTTSIDMSEYAKLSELHNVATTGAYSSLVGTPTIPTNTSDLTNDSGYVTKTVTDLDNYTKTTDLAAVAITGAYNDLTGKPTAITNVSQLSNDEHYIKQSDLATTNISSLYNDVPYATLNEIQGLKDIDVEEIKKAIAAMEHIGTVTQVTAGTGLTGGGNTSVTLNHANSVTAKSGYPTGTVLENGGSFTVRDAQYDAQGHITGTQDRTITMTAIPPYDDTAVRSLISDETTAREITDARVTALESFNAATFNSFVFCIFGIEPYINPETMEIVPNRYYQRSDVDTGIFMDSEKVDIHLKAWLKYHYGIETTDQLKNITCYVYAMGDHGEYVNHMVTYWRQKSNPSITSYPHLQQVGSFSDDGYGSVRRFSTTEVGAILSSTDDGYIAADPLGTGKGYVSGWNTLTERVTTLENTIGTISNVLDEINGEVI